MRSIGFPELLVILGVAVLCPQRGRTSPRPHRSEKKNPASSRGVLFLARKKSDLLLLRRHDRIFCRLGHAELDHFFSWNFDSLTRCGVPPHPRFPVHSN